MIKLQKNVLAALKTIDYGGLFIACRRPSSSAVIGFTELPLQFSSDNKSRRVVTRDPPREETKLPDRGWHAREVTEVQVLKLAGAGQQSKALDLTVELYRKGQALSPKGATVLTSTLSRAGNSDGVLQVSNFIKVSNPSLWSRQIGYEHYYAEALYRSGDIEGSINKFQALYLRHRHHRDKISNLLSFLAIYLSNNNIDAGIRLLSRSCIDLAQQGYFQPLVNVWKCLFTSENGRHHVTAWSLLHERFDIKSFVEKKVPGILSTATDRDDIDMVHRLLEVVLYMEIECCYAEVFSTLLEFYCDRNDLKNARATFDHAQLCNILLRPASFYRYTCFLGSRGIRIPNDVLYMKYLQSTKPNGIKYRF